MGRLDTALAKTPQDINNILISLVDQYNRRNSTAMDFVYDITELGRQAKKVKLSKPDTTLKTSIGIVTFDDIRNAGFILTETDQTQEMLDKFGEAVNQYIQLGGHFNDAVVFCGEAAGFIPA